MTLPHAYPFVLVDRVLALEPGRWAVAVKNVSRNDPLVAETGTLSPALVAEVIAQAAGVAGAGSGAPLLLARVDRFRCRPPFAAGDQLLVVARVVKRLGASVKVRAVVRVGDRTRAAGEVVLHASARATEGRA